ncbi:MAG: ATP-binding cassette domain-containing protein [Candidatus Thermoplasmatota archaeon]|nr:ATP-binding cassette domain-containing protein [Candidatus Thermoplasmatota archaeon]MCL5794662.1 ATP-binding cassette domain-containing protein [Candidatus Thermoplasmatota archaeon]
MEPIIKVENLTKIYKGGVRAVDSISFEINEGEVYGLLGPNGAGKTTTINMLTTRLSPTSGNAMISGHDIIRHSLDIRKMIGVVPQDLTADEDLSGMENLLMVASFYDIPRSIAIERSKRLLEMVDLLEASMRQVRQYSGGMRKRLELIIGLINEPRVLFLDEPTLGLDVQTRTTMWDYIKDLRKNYGMTIILTSHYLEEIDALADRVSIVDHGKILITGTPTELKASLKGDIISFGFRSASDSQAVLEYPKGLDVISSADGMVKVRVENADESLPELMSFLFQRGIKLHTLSVQKPSLDEVFLQYTGRSLREEGPADRMKVMMNMRRVRRT